MTVGVRQRNTVLFRKTYSLAPERDKSGGGVRLGASSSADFKRYRGPFCLPPPGNKRMLKKGCYCKKDVIVKRST